MELKEVCWGDPDGDKYEGILIAEFKVSSLLEGRGLFAGNPLEEQETIYCVIQTAYYRNHKNPGTCSEDKVRSPNLKDTLGAFLSEYVRYRIRLVSERILDNSKDLNVRTFYDKNYFEIKNEFNYLAHLTDNEPTLRFLALYQYNIKNIESLIEEYSEKSLESLLLDDRVRKLVSFMGKKGEETYELAKQVSNTAQEFLVNLKRLILFYL